jgi:hypothetical protein
MKKLCFMTLALSLHFSSSAQGTCEPPVYNFNNKSNVSGTIGVNSEFTFSNVISNVNAIVTITKMQNASITNANMDNASPYTQAWQPFITFPSSRNGGGDSSYIEYKIRFVSSSQSSTLVDQACMAMTIVDCDGNGSGNTYREMVKVSLPGTPMGIANSTIIGYEDARWMLFKSGPATFNNIDTINKAAMGQVNFPANTNTFYMRVGVVGPISANTQRQFSFYFKSFAGLLVPLPVKLSDFRPLPLNSDVNLKWISTDEQQFSHYEVYRSFNGESFEFVSKVDAAGNSSRVANYQYLDANVNSPTNQVFYKLKLVDLNGQFQWSSTRLAILNQAPSTSIVLYPNPVNDVLSIQSPLLLQVTHVSIKNAVGQELMQRSFEVNEVSQWSVADLQAGCYTITITLEDGSVEIHKLLKQ